MAGAIGASRVPGGFQKILQSAVGCGFDGRYGQHGAFVSELLHPRYWPSWLAVGLVRALGLLPLPVLWGLGTCIGRIAYWFAGSRRGVARRNMEICLSDRSDRDREALLKQSFGWLGVAALSQGIGWGISRTRLRRLVKMRNVKVIDDCFEQGQSSCWCRILSVSILPDSLLRAFSAPVSACTREFATRLSIDRCGALEPGSAAYWSNAMTTCGV